MRIRMLIAISGGRADDRAWPPAGAEIDVPDGEGNDLLRGGHAVYVGPSAPPSLPPVPPPLPPLPVPPEPAALVSEPAATAAGPVVPEPAAPEPEPAAEPELPVAPGPADPKNAWIEYAVSKAKTPAEADAAARMSKADLMSRYGGRL